MEQGSMAELVDKLADDAGFANVVYLAALKHLDHDVEDQGADAIVSQLRKLTNRLEKRHRQAGRLLEARQPHG
jgi:hypothetical protein